MNGNLLNGVIAARHVMAVEGMESVIELEDSIVAVEELIYNPVTLYAVN